MNNLKIEDLFMVEKHQQPSDFINNFYVKNNIITEVENGINLYNDCFKLENNSFKIIYEKLEIFLDHFIANLTILDHFDYNANTLIYLSSIETKTLTKQINGLISSEKIFNFAKGYYVLPKNDIILRILPDYKLDDWSNFATFTWCHGIEEFSYNHIDNDQNNEVASLKNMLFYHRKDKINILEAVQKVIDLKCYYNIIFE